MKTNNFLEELKKYFENTPREQVLADWEKSEEFDNVGPTVEDLLLFFKRRQKTELLEHQDSEYTYRYNNFKPELSFGFFVEMFLPKV